MTRDTPPTVCDKQNFDRIAPVVRSLPTGVRLARHGVPQGLAAGMALARRSHFGRCFTLALTGAGGQAGAICCPASAWHRHERPRLPCDPRCAGDARSVCLSLRRHRASCFLFQQGGAFFRGQLLGIENHDEPLQRSRECERHLAGVVFDHR